MLIKYVNFRIEIQKAMRLYFYIYDITIFLICIMIINAHSKKISFLIMLFDCIFLNLLYNL